MTTHEVYREGHVHVLSEKCSSCIFRHTNDGRIMGLRPGRVGTMVKEARENDSVIPCHQTIHVPDEEPAVCHGYYEKNWRDITALRMAEALGITKLVQPPEEE